MIDSFRDEYRFLSNFYKSRIVFEGDAYPTVEHAFQAAKTSILEERVTIRANANPVIAKRKGRRVTLRPDWEIVKQDVLRDLLRVKFADAELRLLLLQTGHEELVEGNRWHDRYWGRCFCDKCGGEGQNALGGLLMQIRDELRQQTQ